MEYQNKINLYGDFVKATGNLYEGIILSHLYDRAKNESSTASSVNVVVTNVPQLKKDCFLEKFSDNLIRQHINALLRDLWIERTSLAGIEKTNRRAFRVDTDKIDKRVKEFKEKEFKNKFY